MSVTNSTNSRTSSRHPKPLLGEFLDVRLRYGFSLACGKYIRIQTERQSIQSFYFISHCLQGYFLIDWFNMALQIFLFWSFIFKLITRVLDFLDWFNMFLSWVYILPRNPYYSHFLHGKSLCFPGPKSRNAPPSPSKLPKNRRNITAKGKFFSKFLILPRNPSKKSLFFPPPPPRAFGRIYTHADWW